MLGNWEEERIKQLLTFWFVLGRENWVRLPRTTANCASAAPRVDGYEKTLDLVPPLQFGLLERTGHIGTNRLLSSNIYS